MIRTGVSLSRSTELTEQCGVYSQDWSQFLVTQADFQSVVGRGLGEFCGVVEGVGPLQGQ